jgi:hypothetical protein
MSDGPIPLLTPEKLRFIAEPPEFTSLVAQEIGDHGSDADGFDVVFNEAASLAAAAPAALASFDQHLTDAGVVVPEFDTAEAAALGADIQPASDAADASLHDFNTTLSGAVGTGPVGPGTGGSPPVLGGRDPVDASDFPGMACSLIDAVANMKVGDAALTTRLSNSIAQEQQPNAVFGNLDSGETDIWSIRVFPDPPGGLHTTDPNVNPPFIYFMEVTINPLRAGKFRAVVRIIHLFSGAPDDLICLGVTVTT